MLGVSFDAGGTVLVSGSFDATLKVWDMRAREAHVPSVVRTLFGHTGPVLAVSCAPRGSLVASASGDKTVRVWDAAAGRQVRVLAGHRCPVECVAWTGDGCRIASASLDKTVCIWRVDEQVCMPCARELRLLAAYRALVGRAYEQRCGSCAYVAQSISCPYVHCSRNLVKLAHAHAGSSKQLRTCSVANGRNDRQRALYIHLTCAHMYMQEAALAFVMGSHPRIGEHSPVCLLDACVVDYIVTLFLENGGLQ